MNFNNERCKFLQRMNIGNWGEVDEGVWTEDVEEEGIIITWEDRVRENSAFWSKVDEILIKRKK